MRPVSERRVADQRGRLRHCRQQVGPGVPGVVQAYSLNREQQRLVRIFGYQRLGTDAARIGGDRRLVCPIGLSYCQQAGNERADQEDPDSRKQAAQPPVHPSLLPHALLGCPLLDFRKPATRGEEVSFRGIEVGMRRPAATATPAQVGFRGRARCPGWPMPSQVSAATLRCRRMRCPCTSSSSQVCNRGQARISASWDSSSAPSSLVTSRALTSSPMSRS